MRKAVGPITILRHGKFYGAGSIIEIDETEVKAFEDLGFTVSPEETPSQDAPKQDEPKQETPKQEKPSQEVPKQKPLEKPEPKMGGNVQSRVGVVPSKK